MRPGTGKSRPAIELVRSIPDVDYILWLAPFNSVHTTIEGSGIVSEVQKWGGLENVEFLGIESLKIKNWEARRTKRIIELGGHCEYKTYFFIYNNKFLIQGHISI